MAVQVPMQPQFQMPPATDLQGLPIQQSFGEIPPVQANAHDPNMPPVPQGLQLQPAIPAEMNTAGLPQQAQFQQPPMPMQQALPPAQPMQIQQPQQPIPQQPLSSPQNVPPPNPVQIAPQPGDSAAEADQTSNIPGLPSKAVDVAEAIESGQFDGYLDAIDASDKRKTVTKAIIARREALSGVAQPAPTAAPQPQVFGSSLVVFVPVPVEKLPAVQSVL